MKSCDNCYLKEDCDFFMIALESLKGFANYEFSKAIEQEKTNTCENWVPNAQDLYGGLCKIYNKMNASVVIGDMLNFFSAEEMQKFLEQQEKE